MLLAVQADGATIDTVEGLAANDELSALQQAFSDKHRAAVRLLHPGMLMSASALLAENPHPSEYEIKEAIQGNICAAPATGTSSRPCRARGGGSMSTPPRTRHGRPHHRTSVPRKEDRRLVQGQGVFVDDIKRHNMGYVHFVRSPYAHARSSRVDLTRPLEAPA